MYDLLGREVATLANGHHTAGYHNVQWSTDNGKLSSGMSSKGGYASGVYFARFTATTPAGEVKHAKVNKLILTK